MICAAQLEQITDKYRYSEYKQLVLCKEFQRKLRVERAKNELRQADVAEFLGICISAYGAYEVGKNVIPPKTLKKLANLYDISVMDFLEISVNKGD